MAAVAGQLARGRPATPMMPAGGLIDRAAAQRAARELSRRLPGWRGRLTLREAYEDIQVPVWITSAKNAKNLARVLDGAAERELHGNLVPAVHGLGDRRLAQVTPRDVEIFLHEVQMHVGTAEVVEALVRGNPLSSYDADDHGFGAARMSYLTLSRLLSLSVQSGFVGHNVTKEVKEPPCGSDRRPLTDEEVERLLAWVTLSERDPELGLLIIKLLYCTGMRAEGLLSLTMDAIDVHGCRVHTWQKGGKRHETPVRRSLLLALLEHCRSRGGTERHDIVLRQANGSPITRKVLQGVFHRAQHDLVWGAFLGVSAHWFRHTCLDRVDTAAASLGLPAEEVRLEWGNHSLRGRFGAAASYTAPISWPTKCRVSEAAFGQLADRDLMA